MPIVYEGKLDGSSGVRYFQYSLVGFYLDQAFEHASKAKDHCRPGILQASSIIGIMFSVMALEAFINEISEDLIPAEELDDFIFLKRKYRKQSGESSVSAKLRVLFKLKYNQDIEGVLLENVEASVQLRNNLVHYKLTELAGKFIMPPIESIKAQDGRIMSCIDFTSEPERIDPPFISKVNGDAAANCFNSTLLIINYWGELKGVSDNVPGLVKIT